jgi:hypothetical protein
MIIRDLEYKDNHVLADGKLSETIGRTTGKPYHIFLADIPQARKDKVIMVYGAMGNRLYQRFNVRQGRIGCRTFSPATFAKILKAAGVRKMKPAKKGKK